MQDHLMETMKQMYMTYQEQIAAGAAAALSMGAYQAPPMLGLATPTLLAPQPMLPQFAPPPMPMQAMLQKGNGSKKGKQNVAQPIISNIPLKPINVESLSMLSRAKPKNLELVVNQEGLQSIMGTNTATIKCQACKDSEPSFYPIYDQKKLMPKRTGQSKFMLQCELCFLAIHKECYGPSAYLESKVHDLGHAKAWLCDRCMNAISCQKKDPLSQMVDLYNAYKCNYCQQGAGLMKSIDPPSNAQWVHYECVLNQGKVA